MSLITFLCFIYHWLIVNWDTSAILVICRKLKTGNDIIYNLSPSLRIKRYIHLSTFLHGSKEYETNTLIHTFYIVSTTFYRINTHACTNNLQPLKHSTFQGTVWNKGWVNGKWCTNVERDKSAIKENVERSVNKRWKIYSECIFARYLLIPQSAIPSEYLKVFFVVTPPPPNKDICNCVIKRIHLFLYIWQCIHIILT